jgi:SRSO17 transposase
MTCEQMAALEAALVEFLRRFDGCFAQDRTGMHLREYLLGLLTDLPRKSIEPIALAAGVSVRTLQAFLAHFRWDHALAHDLIQRIVAQEHAAPEAIGVIDASGHAKQGDKTPGVQRQYCGETGKIDNCVVGQHLLYTDNHPGNPFCCMLASDLFLPQDWSADRDRCREAGIPDTLVHRPKWQIALEQLRGTIANGVRFAWVTFDEDYGGVGGFWQGLDQLGLWGAGEARASTCAWVREPGCISGRAEHAARRVDNLVTYSPAFTGQVWQEISVKTTTRGKLQLQVKAAAVYLVAHKDPSHHGPGIPIPRRYWLIVTRAPRTGEIRYIVSNAPFYVSLHRILQVVFARWHVEKWFERAKQEAGLGAFEVRTYTSLIRHWLIVRMAMLFLARQTRRLREKKSADHLRADRPGGQRDCLDPVATDSPFPPGSPAAVCVLPAA